MSTSATGLLAYPLISGILATFTNWISQVDRGVPRSVTTTVSTRWPIIDFTGYRRDAIPNQQTRFIHTALRL
jgi:hypothetical protein